MCGCVSCFPVANVYYIVGDDTDEGTFFVPNCQSSQDLFTTMTSNYPNLSQDNLNAILASYPEGIPAINGRPSWYGPCENAYGEATFTCPGLEITKATAQYLDPNKTWQYRYNVADPGYENQGLGVPHTSEDPAIFGADNNGGPCNGCSYGPGALNEAMVPILMNFWTSFATTLDPNTHKDSTAPDWPSWGESGGQRLRFELNNNGMEAIDSSQQARCDMWKSLVPAMEQK